MNDGRWNTYLCHKTVRAFKIKEIIASEKREFYFDYYNEEGDKVASMHADFKAKHNPEVGGYIVEYEYGGYMSYSPAEPFESGYTLKDLAGNKQTQPAIMKYFKYDHLPGPLQGISKPFCDLANRMDLALPDGAEKSAGLRKLLEAKDCAVRAML